MKTKHILAIFTVVILLSCNTEKKSIEGEIYIKLVDVHNIYGAPDSKIEAFKERVLNPNQETYSKSERQLNKLYKILMDEGLFNVPQFKLKTKNGEIINVYTSKEEYLKLDSVFNGFDRDKEKILIHFEGEKFSDGVFNEPLYKASKIISIEKISGTTAWDK